MRNSFLLLIFLSSFSHAQYLINYQSNQYCIDSYSIVDGTPRIKVVLSRDKTSNILTLDASTIKNGYEYNSTLDACSPIPKNNVLGLSNDEYDFSMALTGLFVSSLLSLFVFAALRLSL